MPAALLLAVALAVAPSPAPVGPDSLRSDGEVRATVLRHASDVRRCYQDEGLRRNPGLMGHVELELTILPTGRVDSVTVSAISLRGDGVKEVTTCLARTARQWRFERGAYLVEQVVFPFVFAPGPGAAGGPSTRADE
jgi:hypothetical protein